MPFGIQFSPGVEAWFTSQSTTTNAALARIEAAIAGLVAMGKKLMADVDDLTTAVAGMQAELGRYFTVQQNETINIEAALSRINAQVGSNPSVQAQIGLITAATTKLKAANDAAQSESDKLAAALGPAAQP